MAFPIGPTDGQLWTEGGRNYIFRSAANAWEIAAVAGTTNLSIANVTGTTLDVASSTGTDATVPAATTTEAGVMTAADKVRLDGMENGATADQNASEVPVTAAGNLASTNVQDALQELQGDIDALAGLGGVYAGAAATVAALPTTREDGNPVQNGDTAILSADDGANQSGWWVYDGTNWQFAKEIPETVAAATETAAGIVELATTAEAAAGTDTTRAVTAAGLAVAVPALETTTTLVNTTGTSQLTYTDEDAAATNLDLRIPTGATLPADATNERAFVLLGHATLPDGLYMWGGTFWVQV